MKTIKYLFVLPLVMIIFACNNNTKNNNSNQNDSSKIVINDSKVKVLYFHGDRRCKTCVTVGEVSKFTLIKEFKDTTQVKFMDINYDIEGNEKLVEKYQVSGSSLIIAGSDNYEDITVYAFNHAVDSPDSLEIKIINEVKKRL